MAPRLKKRGATRFKKTENVLRKFIADTTKKLFSLFLAVFICLGFACCKDDGLYALQIRKSDALNYVYTTYTKRVSQRFVENKEFEALGLTGEYKGNAVEFSESQLAYSNNNYFVKLKITQEEYEQRREEGYDKLYIWLCVVYTGQQTVCLSSYNDAFIGNAINLDKDKQNVWFQHKIHLTAKVKNKLFDENGEAKTLPLLSTYFSKTEAGQRITFFVGDIGFCK